MKLFQALTGLLVAFAVSQSAIAQGFSTGSSPWARQPAGRYLSDYRTPGLGSSSKSAVQNASYWPERDPGFRGVERTTYRPTAEYDAYRGAYDSGYSGRCASASGFGGSPVGPVGSGNYGPLPANYYKGDGIFGKDTVYAKDQPVRNFFRYILP